MYSAVIVAAGIATRMEGADDKVLLELAGKPVISHAVERFREDSHCAEIILVANRDNKERLQGMFKDSVVVLGGSARQESVFNGVEAAASDYVFIHDGARPYFTHRLLNDLYRAVLKHQAATPGVSVNDTLRYAEKGFIADTVSRKSLFHIQTPQAFYRPLLLRTMDRAKEDDRIFTCEAGLLKHYGIDTAIVDGVRENIKLTRREDMFLLELILDAENRS